MSTKKPPIFIEKYDMSSFEKEKKPYVMICTDVIQKMTMKNSQAFLMWVFLESLPTTWKPNRYHLMQHFDISPRTYERHMSWLNTVGLIEYRQNRLEDGSFDKGHLVILNGTKFNPDAECNGTVKIGGTVINKKKPKVIHKTDDTRTVKFGDSVKPSIAQSQPGLKDISPNRQITEPRCFGVHINKTKTNKENKKTNTVFSSSVDIKNHLTAVTKNRELTLSEDEISQIIFYIAEDRAYDSVCKKINIALKLIRDKKWNIPNGWNGITIQSIKEKEEELQKAKIESFKLDKIGMSVIRKKVDVMSLIYGAPKNADSR